MTRTLLFLGLLATGLSVAEAGSAQEITWTAQPRRGWLGVSIEYTEAVVGNSVRTVVVVTDVTAQSPAAAAGVRPGDTITHIEGQVVSPRTFATLGQGLAPGDLVRLTLRRGASAREVLVEAAPWPASQSVVVMPGAREVVIPNPGEMVIHLDSVRGAILQNLDSLVLSIRHLRGDSLGHLGLQVLRDPTRSQEQNRGAEFRYRIVEPSVHWTNSELLFTLPELAFTVPELSFPFETFLVRSPATDSLRTALDQAARSLAEVRRGELSRIQEIQATLPRVTEQAIREDLRVRELRTREEALVAERQRLQERLQQVSEEEMRRQWAETQWKGQEAIAQSRAALERARGTRAGTQEEEARRLRALEDEVYTPRRIVALGQSFVLGAQLQALNPDLAQYFPVDRGILVTQVVEGTPAAEAGFRGGDVIVRVGADEVASLEDLRFFLESLPGPLRREVVRKGETVTLVVRR